MIYLLWSLPALAVIAAIGSGRLDTIRAAVLGLSIAVPVAVLTGPAAFGAAQLTRALARGLWIGATIAPYILGGLLFWQIAAHGAASPADANAPGLQAPGASPVARRRLLFFACFLIGPFAESATGFGVGMLGTVTLIRRLDIAPRPLMIFALLSQTMIPWGAMGSGTMLAAALAHIPGAELGLYAMVPVGLLMPVWLALFWRTARDAGLGVSAAECLREALWVAAGLALLAPATAWLGPESALLAAYGPLIVLRYLRDARPDRRTAWATARRAWPYVALIAVLVATRLLPALEHALQALWKIAPFDDLPAWSPFFHAGSWLVAGGIATALARRQGGRLVQEVRSACKIGRPAVLAVFLFAMMAEVLSGAGISRACAQGMFDALHRQAVLATPFLASVLGILANSGNAPNSLFMPSQIALAVQAGLSIPAVAALQHVSGTSMSLFSPVRMSMAAGLARGIGQERAVYRALLPYAACCLILLLFGAIGIVLAK
ncbi:MAG: hypothetical protein ACTHJ1_07785 [Bordetella sp.]|uniref:hypothetical protein n=1 Tax=Bordetella sp. TaxID=28081 RepID=UPI003F7C645D